MYRCENTNGTKAKGAIKECVRLVLDGLPVECMFVLAGVLSDLDGSTFAKDGLA